MHNIFYFFLCIFINTKKGILVFMVCSFILFLSLVYLTALLVMGVLHLNDCPISPFIPKWACIGGSAFILLLICAYLLGMALLCKLRVNSCIVSTLSSCAFTLGAFSLIWFFIGTIYFLRFFPIYFENLLNIKSNCIT